MAPFSPVTNERGVVSCDWLALSCQLSRPRDGRPLVAPAGWSCLSMTPTAVWGERWFILDRDGNKVATLLCNPRSPNIAPDRAMVEIANRWLYYDDFHDTCDKVLDVLPMVITGLNRVDLCCDFEMNEDRYSVYKRLARGDAYVKALRSGSVWWQDVSLGDVGAHSELVRVPHCMTFGGKESVFKWKVYYKWLELQQAPPDAKKPYITDLWRDMGFNEKAVWRVEVSVSDTNRLCGVDGSRILPMAWYDERVRLFCDLYNDKFVVRANQGHKDKRNDEVLTFLSVDGGRSVRHALPRGSHDDSDPERRTTCKLWKELQQSDTQCNDVLTGILKRSLRELCERPTNVWVLQRTFNLDVSDIVTALA